MKALLSLFLALMLLRPTRAQDFTGIWSGFITANDGTTQLPSSGYSLNIKQQDGQIISGNAYIYGKFELKFEGLFDFIGTVNPENKRITVTELKILKYVQPAERYLLCVKLEDLQLIEENQEQFLVGHWEGSALDGRECLPGNVVLKKLDPGKPDSAIIPSALMSFISADTETKTTFLGTTLAKPLVIQVNSLKVQIEVRDYMKEDNDTISVYYNRNAMARNLRISKRPKRFSLLLSPRSELSEIILYAENLGLIPPNTANLTIDDGTQKHRLLIESDKQKSAVIYLRYSGFKKDERFTEVQK